MLTSGIWSSLLTWLSENKGKSGSFAVVVVLLIGTIVWGANAILDRLDAADATNVSQQEQIDANADLIDTNAGNIEQLRTDLEEHLAVWDAFFNANEATPGTYQLFVNQTDTALKYFDDWLMVFYNEDEDTLGEWQQLLADYEEFKQDTEDDIDGFYDNFSAWYSNINSRLNALETEPEV